MFWIAVVNLCAHLVRTGEADAVYGRVGRQLDTDDRAGPRQVKLMTRPAVRPLPTPLPASTQSAGRRPRFEDHGMP